MFGFIKNLFVAKSEEESDANGQAPLAHAPAANSAHAQPVSSPAARPAPRTAPQTPTGSNGNSIYVSLQAVLNGFPAELKSRVRQSDVGDATISIPLDKILSQLTSGIVRIPYGEIRRAASQIFTAGKEADQVAVVLPLDEVLAQIDPAMLGRRQNQKQIQVPEEISSPFGDQGQGLVLSSVPGKTPAVPARTVTPAAPVQPKPAPARSAAPPAIQPSPLRPAPAQPAPARPAPIQSAPARLAPVPPAPAKPAAPKPAPAKPSAAPAAPARPAPAQPAIARMPQAAPIKPASPLPPQPAAPRAPILSTPKPPAAAKSADGPPPAIVAPAALRSLGASLSSAAPIAPAISQAAEPELEEEVFEASALPLAQPASNGALVNVPLADLFETWSDALRREIAQQNLANAVLALPADTIEDAMKLGRVAFPWKVLRSWIKPALVPAPSAHDNTVLELPLKLIAPMFLARKRDANKSQQKVAIDDNIPNLFFGFPQPESGTAEVGGPDLITSAPVNDSPGKTVDTNYYVWDDTSDSAMVDETESKRKSPGTEFVTRYATPNEVVSRAAALDGVSGSLIALPDGLMVASKLSSDLNGDTLAAFLPHIFGKVSQCTKELRMGELNNLNFTVGNVPWKIFRVNAIFFAAFGRVGKPLPTAQLAALAAELDHKKQ